MDHIYYFKKNCFDKIFNDSRLNNSKKTLALSLMCKINTLYSIQKAGSGHLGSSLSALDIFFNCFYFAHLNNKENIHIFSSKGHDAPGYYNVLAIFNKISFSLIHKLRRLNGLPGHPDVTTKYILFNTGSLGMGISKANGRIFYSKKNEKKNVIVILGDGELQEGQNWEALRFITNNKEVCPLIFIDSNKIQSDTWVSKVSHLGNLKKIFSSIGLPSKSIDGNNHNEIQDALKSHFSKNNRTATIIIANTQKSSGIDFAETKSFNFDDRFYQYHSGSLSHEKYILAFDSLNKKLSKIFLQKSNIPKLSKFHIHQKNKEVKTIKSLVSQYSDSLLLAFKHNSKLIALDADLAKDTGCHIIFKHFPNRFVEFGISEQDMVSFGSGLSSKGFTPIFHSFACFLTTRAQEQIFNFLTESRPGIFIGCLAGILPAGPGHSHQMIRDISILSSMPNLILVEPFNLKQFNSLFKKFSNFSKSLYIRITNVPLSNKFEKYNLPKIGDMINISSHKKMKKNVIIFQGSIFLNELEDMQDLINKTNYSFFICVWLNKFNDKWLSELNDKNIILYENHFYIGGIGDQIKSRLIELNIRPSSFKSINIKNIPFCGNNIEVLKKYKFDKANIIKEINKLLA